MNPIVTPILGIIGKVFEHIWPDPAQQAEAQLKLAELQQSGELAELNADLQLALAQIQTNQIEAQSDNIFKSGWRPFIGWVCGGAFAWNFAAAPALTWLINLAYGAGYLVRPITFAAADMSQMMPVLLGLLGLGGLRTMEKIKGAA